MSITGRLSNRESWPPTATRGSPAFANEIEFVTSASVTDGEQRKQRRRARHVQDAGRIEEARRCRGEDRKQYTPARPACSVDHLGQERKLASWCDRPHGIVRLTGNTGRMVT